MRLGDFGRVTESMDVLNVRLNLNPDQCLEHLVQLHVSFSPHLMGGKENFVRQYSSILLEQVFVGCQTTVGCNIFHLQKNGQHSKPIWLV